MGCSKSSKPIAPVPSSRTHGFHDKYVLGKRLGALTHGQVYEVFRIPRKTKKNDAKADAKSSVVLEHRRSVKVVDLRMANPRLLKILQNEVALWKKAGKHENIVHTIETFQGIGAGSDLCYMVMEYVHSLFCHIDMIDVDEGVAAAIFYQMLSALEHLHEKPRLVHRDVKPGSFYVGGPDHCTIKLCDLALAEHLPQHGEENPWHRKVHGEVGSLPFMCPEMIRGDGYDEKADIWSLGVLVYLILFGRYPYLPADDDAESFIMGKGRHNPRQATALKAAIASGESKIDWRSSSVRSGSAIAFVMILLSRAPEERPSAAEALKLSYMVGVTGDHYKVTDNLPSLRPEIEKAKVLVSADLDVQGTGMDDLLSHLQMEKHGIPLPTETELKVGASKSGTRSGFTETLSVVATKSRDTNRSFRSQVSMQSDRGKHKRGGSKDRLNYDEVLRTTGQTHFEPEEVWTECLV